MCTSASVSSMSSGALIEFACVCYLDKHFKTKISQKAAQEKEKSMADEKASQNRHLIRTIDSFGTPRDPRYCKKKPVNSFFMLKCSTSKVFLEWI